MKPAAPIPERSRGWLLDLYPLDDAMILWFILEDGRRRRVVDRAFEPQFYVEGGPRELTAFRKTVARSDGFEAVGKTARRDIWSGREAEVEAVAIRDLENHPAALARLYRRHPGLAYHSCDINLAAVYCYERGIFPTAFCELTTTPGDEPLLLSCRTDEDAWDTDYPMPPLREAELMGEGLRLRPRPAIGRLTLNTAERSVTWEAGEDPRDVLESLNRLLALDEPDLIWTEGGDSLTLPVLFALTQQMQDSRRARRGDEPFPDLALDREPGIRRRIATRGHSVQSYGRIMYMAPDYPLFGRWHIDRRNSFWALSTGLDGLMEIIRLCKLPPQRTARRSIGTGLSSMQFEAAYRAGCLIPWKKTQPEDWKSVTQLVQSDRGGLVFQPLTGAYENVAEIDFASMFPTIMFRHKVSPELINCACCDNRAVPGLGYTICEKREGLISGILEPIVAKRQRYKALRSAAATPEERARWNARQEALKWILVCCFGYLGYKNARFGRIEAHESTTAFARDLLLRSKELVEERGFRVLHANVDCFWMQREEILERGLPAGSALDKNQMAPICEEIEALTQIPMALEGIYSWVVFLPSRQDPSRPVPTRWFGRFTNGTFKYRGIELRRSDTCPLVKELQAALFDALSPAASLAECRTLRPRLLAVVEDFLARLRERDVPLEDLAIKISVSKEADEYRGNSKTAVAARQAARAGMAPHPGEAVRFVVIDNAHPVADERLRLLALLAPEDAYDADFYDQQLRDAARTILAPLLGESGLSFSAASQQPPQRPRQIQTTLFDSLPTTPNEKQAALR